MAKSIVIPISGTIAAAVLIPTTTYFSLFKPKKIEIAPATSQTEKRKLNDPELQQAKTNKDEAFHKYHDIGIVVKKLQNQLDDLNNKYAKLNIKSQELSSLLMKMRTQWANFGSDDERSKLYNDLLKVEVEYNETAESRKALFSQINKLSSELEVATTEMESAYHNYQECVDYYKSLNV